MQEVAFISRILLEIKCGLVTVEMPVLNSVLITVFKYFFFCKRERNIIVNFAQLSILGVRCQQEIPVEVRNRETRTVQYRLAVFPCGTRQALESENVVVFIIFATTR